MPPPSEYYVQSPLGLVPKSGNKTRLIFHLSYNFGSQEQDKSINYHTPQELCMVKYRDLDHAIRNCLSLLHQAGISGATIFYSKTDCSNAFCLAPVLVRQRILLTMMAVHPLTNKKWYFVDKCLPFGSSRSCEIFQQFSDALAYLAKMTMIRDKIVDNPVLTNYLDDFLFMALTLCICDAMMRTFLRICDFVGCPISDEKTEWSAPMMVFLGMLLNGIVPGRAFTRGMYDKLRIRNSAGQLLRQHHHIWLNNEFLQDCYVWLRFLDNASNAQLCRPLADFNP